MEDENTLAEPAQGEEKPKSALKRFWPLALIAIALSLFFALGGPEYISLEYLKNERAKLTGFVADNLVLAVGAFIMLYAVLTGISFPGASLLSIFGGFLFGTLLGGSAIVIGATIGATAIFLAARYVIGDSLSKKAGPYMQKFESGLKESEFSYLFILRLIPAFPFFIVNIVPALFDVKLRNYVITTFLGIIPGCFVYASVGASAGAFFDQGEEPNLSGLMTDPKILFPILGLIALSTLPIIYKKFIKKGAAA